MLKLCSALLGDEQHFKGALERQGVLRNCPLLEASRIKFTG